MIRTTCAAQLLATTVCLLWGFQANAQERLIEYVVVKGDTCEGIARKLYGSPKYCYKMLSRYNKLDKKYKLEPGQVLKLPSREALDGAPDAELAERRGDVEARKPDDQSWFKAALGEQLWSRWRVSTAERASARVQFVEDQSSLELRESTLVIIYGPRTSKVASQAGARAELERGALRSRLGELSGKPSRVVVETPAAQATLEGGQSIVSVEPQGGATRVANHTGKKVEVAGLDPAKKKPSKRRVSLPANTGSKVEPGKDPTPPRPLPPAPAWPSAEPIMAATLGESGVVEISWTAASQADVVRLELAKNQDGTGLLDLQLVPGSLSRARLEGLPVGEYWVRLASVDADAFEGIAGPARRVIVSAAQPRWEGRAEGAPVLPGQVLTVSGLRCAADGGQPVERLVMPRAGSLTITCQDAQGHALAPLTVDVAPVALSQVAPGEQVIGARGAPVEISFTTTPAVDRLSIEPPAGWAVAQPPALVGERWQLVLVPGADAQPGALRLLAGEGGELGSLPLDVQEPAPAAILPLDVYPWSVQPMFSYSALYSDGYRFGERRVARGWRAGLRLGRELGAGFNLELEGHVGRLLPESAAERFMVAGGQLAALWRPWRGVSPFILMGSGVEIGLGEQDDALLWTLSGGAGLMSPVTERLTFRLEVREVVAPLADDGLGLHTQAGLSLMLSF